MSKKSDKPTLWERYLTKEIGIEFKACLYFYALLFFYCIFRLVCGRTDASIWHMAQMIFSTYVMGYLQVYVFWNFDEADALHAKEILAILVCTGIYTGVSYLCGWFDKNPLATLIFAAYVIFLYVCVFLVYRTRRQIDDKLLNDELRLFKTRDKSK
ncbi:MAG: DUF3021 domain-containing protein [Agathobacter sp.]